MKNKGKRSGGLVQRFSNWVLGTKPPTEQHAQISQNGNQISQWPSEYDNTAFEGYSTDVGGKTCRTAGEHKAATARFYRDKW